MSKQLEIKLEVDKKKQIHLFSTTIQMHLFIETSYDYNLINDDAITKIFKNKLKLK